MRLICSYPNGLAERSEASTVRELEEFGIQRMHPTLITPVFDISSRFDTDDCSAIESFTHLLKILSQKLRDTNEVITTKSSQPCICLWTCNAEGSCTDGMGGNKVGSLSGGSIWGTVRSAALEIDTQSLELICIDTDSFDDKYLCSLNQVLQDLSVE